MKIQIIQLERYDDVISTRDKLAWAKTARVLLVWPRSAQILSRRLDLVILERTSISLGTQLGLVTKDRLVRENARQIGIPVFSSVVKAQHGTWRRGRLLLHPELRRKPQPDLRALQSQARTPIWPRWLSHAWARLGVFGAGILAVLVLVLSFVPSAEIVIVPQTKLQQMTLPVLVSSKIKSANISGNLPARPISAVVEGTRSAKTTGLVEIPDQFASGLVRFTNLTDQDVSVPAGTVVQAETEPHPRYVTIRGGEISGGAGNYQDLPIQAIQPGAEGNVNAGAIQAIEGSLGLSLRVNNEGPISGGYNRTSPGASQVDFNLLRQQLEEELQLAAQKEMEARLSAGDRLIPETLEIKNILDENSEPAINQPADELSLSLRLEYTAIYISGVDFLALGSAALDMTLPAGYHPVADSLQVEGVGKPEIDSEQTISWYVSAHRMVQRSLVEDQVVSLALGLSPQQAVQRLGRQLPLDGVARITLNPVWWPRLPILPFRIAVYNRS